MTHPTILIKWKDMSPQLQIKDFLEQKIQKIFDFVFVEENVKAEYTYYHNDNLYQLKLKIQIHKKEQIIAEATNEDIKSATIQAIDKLVDQLRRIKTKIHNN